jgi:hypothetical protein
MRISLCGVTMLLVHYELLAVPGHKTGRTNGQPAFAGLDNPVQKPVARHAVHTAAAGREQCAGGA